MPSWRDRFKPGQRFRYDDGKQAAQVEFVKWVTVGTPARPYDLALVRRDSDGKEWRVRDEYLTPIVGHTSQDARR